jgi:hypothetical protein
MNNRRSRAPCRVLENVSLALFSTVLSLMLIEMAFRFMMYYDDMRTSHAFQNLGRTPIVQDPNTFDSFRQIIQLSKNPRIIYELIPNLSITSNRSMLFRDKQYTMNSHGFRGPEYTRAKSHNIFRLVGVGDSVMWGWRVSDDEYYLALLQPYLNQSSPDDYNWEIINTAVPGYNTVMEVETFKEKGLHYHPDLVIVGYVGNDLSLPNYIRKEENYFDLRRSFALEFFSSWLTHPHEHFHDGLIDAPNFESNPSRVPDQYKDMVGIEAYRSAMADLKTLSLEHNFQVVVFTDGRFPDTLKQILGDLHFPTLEGFAVLEKYRIQHNIQEYQGSPLTVSRDDPHPSALAHAMLAGVLYNYLKESNILDQIFKRRGVMSISK